MVTSQSTRSCPIGGSEEVEYDEIVELAKRDEKRDEIRRQRDGYQRILDSCGKQVKKDGYKWLWVDTSRGHILRWQMNTYDSIHGMASLYNSEFMNYGLISR